MKINLEHYHVGQCKNVCRGYATFFVRMSPNVSFCNHNFATIYLHISKTT